ncbi:formamidopyrimidine-DNA glycosylase [Pseudonocardia endophytica]|uniref:Formamidopyrimidine-DNA glycosylase n=1 Tax=Pseudonocardia endophytica TaxID=401976 RepID=A0A4R1HLI3_PSEEN|nr:formamidopyrimidine-DNA glycosylase [Pseudonocardia endophytica]
MPELPEVENARQVLALAVGREIASIDDRDEWLCRPHRAGDIATALKGGRLTATHRRGKTMWCDTETSDGDEGPALGVHLGMGGRIVVTDPDGDRIGGGTKRPDRRPRKAEWDRFTIDFTDGGQFRLFDKRRLGRIRLDPDLSDLGPDAENMKPAEFRDRISRGRSAVKARLLDQSVLAGVGNLLADQTLWQARIDPSARANELTRTELDRLHRNLNRALADAVENGGVHTGNFIEHRHTGGHCPRCGTEVERGKVGGRTTWWCPKEQHA